MNIAREHTFGNVKGFEMGYGPIGNPIMNTFFYYIDNVLIDTGQRNMNKYFINYISDIKIDKVILTHFHEDHSGNAGTVKRIKNVPVYGHPIAIEKLKDGFNILLYQKYLWGSAEPVEVLPLPEVIETEKYSLIPIHTPGHSKDHTVFYEKNQGWVFSGDLFLSTRIKYFRADEHMKATIESLKKISKLDFDTLFCAHNPQITNGKKKIMYKLEYLSNFYEDIMDLLNTGYDDERIMRFINKEVKLIKLLTGGNVSFENMVNSTINDIIDEKSNIEFY